MDSGNSSEGQIRQISDCIHNSVVTIWIWISDSQYKGKNLSEISLMRTKLNILALALQLYDYGRTDSCTDLKTKYFIETTVLF